MALLAGLTLAEPCRVTVTEDALPHRRNIGILNGLAASTPDAAISQLAPHSFRFEPAKQADIVRLAQKRLGVGTVQFILGPYILSNRSSLSLPELEAACWPNVSAECPLPGSAADPEFESWEAAITETVTSVLTTAAAAQALGAAPGEIIWDVCNEPNFVVGPGSGGGG